MTVKEREWSEAFVPVRYGVGPKSVSKETHEIQVLVDIKGIWRDVTVPSWSMNFEYRYRLRTPDLTQLSDEELEAKRLNHLTEVEGIVAELERRDEEELDEWVVLVGKIHAIGYNSGEFYDVDAARFLRDTFKVLPAS